MSHTNFENCLDTIQCLVFSMQGLSAVSSKNLYSAVDTLLVDLVGKLEDGHCEDERIYLKLGEILDASRSLTDSNRNETIELKALATVLARIGSLRSELRMYSMVS